MAIKLKGTKHFGPQSCDSCGREFQVADSQWECPHCGFDNKAGAERFAQIGRVAANKRRKQSEAKHEPR